MKTQKLIAVALLFGSSLAGYAQEVAETAEKTSGGMPWEEIIFGTFLLATILFVPMVIYTNIKEKLNLEPDESDPLQALSDEERNERAMFILDEVDQKLTHFESEEGEDMITIEKWCTSKIFKKYAGVFTSKTISNRPND